MKFKEYLELINKKPVTWAKEKGLSVSSIWRAFTGKHFPSPKVIEQIKKASNDAVRPEDWY